jgi:hypothetical protein
MGEACFALREAMLKTTILTEASTSSSSQSALLCFFLLSYSTGNFTEIILAGRGSYFLVGLPPVNNLTSSSSAWATPITVYEVIHSFLYLSP